MTDSSSEGLHLKGALQISTAHEALKMSGASPKAQEMLRALLHLHDVTSDSDSDSRPLQIYIGDETAKEDVVSSLGHLVQSPEAQQPVKEAARGLLELLQEAK